MIKPRELELAFTNKEERKFHFKFETTKAVADAMELLIQRAMACMSQPDVVFAGVPFEQILRMLEKHRRHFAKGKYLYVNKGEAYLFIDKNGGMIVVEKGEDKGVGIVIPVEIKDALESLEEKVDPKQTECQSST